MTALRSTIDPDARELAQNAAAMRALVRVSAVGVAAFMGRRR